MSWRYSTAEMSSRKSLQASTSESLLEIGLPLFFLDVVREFAHLSVLHHEKEVLVRLDDLVKWDYLIKLDDIGMLHLAEDVDLSADAHQVILLLDLLFFEDLDGDLLAR